MLALDHAVCETISDEFSWLKQGNPGIGLTSRLIRARSEVLKLGQTETPDYNDELVPAVYAVAYQLQHINLTYSLINDLMFAERSKKSVLAPTGNLQVVDFGAGALAMQFGLALVVAEALESGENVEAVHVDSIDPSEEMLMFGMAM